MSRHVPRSDRWQSQGPDGYRSIDGPRVRRYKGQWWADIAYQLLGEDQEGAATGWTHHLDTLGPFRRPRNAMVEAERHVTMLRNRHGERVRFEAPDGEMLR